MGVLYEIGLKKEESFCPPRELNLLYLQSSGFAIDWREAKVRWIDKARDIAKEYKHNCQELQQIKEYLQVSIASGGSPVVSGKISKPVEAAVERKMMQSRYLYLQQAVNAVENAMETVLQKPQGDLTIKLFNMVYYDKSYTLCGAAQALNLTERTARRYNWFFLKMVAESMGFINFTSEK